MVLVCRGLGCKMGKPADAPAWGRGTVCAGIPGRDFCRTTCTGSQGCPRRTRRRPGGLGAVDRQPTHGWIDQDSPDDFSTRAPARPGGMPAGRPPAAATLPAYRPRSSSRPAGSRRRSSSPGSRRATAGRARGGNVSPGPQYFYLTDRPVQHLQRRHPAGRVRRTFITPAPCSPPLQGPTDRLRTRLGRRRDGQGSSISSGYNTALSISNNYGMGTTALGSVTAHISGHHRPAHRGDGRQQPVDRERRQTRTPATPPRPPPNAGQGPFQPQDRLLGKGLGGPGGLLIGPGTSNPSSMSPKR